MGRECVEMKARKGEDATLRDKEQECGRWKGNKNPQMELEVRKKVGWGMYRMRWNVLSEVTTGHYLKAFW